VVIKIAIIGPRGIPAKYGGFETFVEELSTRLVSKGYDVYTSCEPITEPRPTEYKGVKLLYFPLKPPNNPFLRTIYEVIYDIYFLIRCSLICDYIYVLGICAGFFHFIPRIFGKTVLVNPDGMEWKRSKFNKVLRSILYLQSSFSILICNIVIADSFAIKKYIDLNYPKKAMFIAYGVDAPNPVIWDENKLKTLGSCEQKSYSIERNDFYLIVARLEPENNICMMVEGFLMSNSNKKLVIVGNFSNDLYKVKVNKILQKFNGINRIIFTGSIYTSDLLNMLRQNCFVYLHGHSVGGTNPSLLEAMVMKNIIIAHNNEFNKEVGDKCLIYFNDQNDLAFKISELELNITNYMPLKNCCYMRVKNKYSWDIITDNYILMFNQYINKKGD
jgi:glycosyltransferase involved in cell wall biosynthesis